MEVPSALQKPPVRKYVRLSAWSFVAGVLVLFVYGAFAERIHKESQLKYSLGVLLILGVIWLFGTCSGVFAVRHKSHLMNRGEAARVWFAIVSNGFFLILSVVGCFFVSDLLLKTRRYENESADREAAAVKARVGEGEAYEAELAAIADRNFQAKVLKAQKNYYQGTSAATNPTVLDVSSVRTIEELRYRADMIRDYIEASQDLRDFCRDSADIYKREVARHRLSKQTQRALLGSFLAAIQKLNPTILELREAELRKGQAMLTMLTQLEEAWGQWSYDHQAGSLKFERESVSKNYKEAWKKIDAAEADMNGLEAKIKALQNAEPSKDNF